MTDLVPVRRALLSVSDKTGLAEFAMALHREFAVELVSTGGTAKFLRDAGLSVTDVADVTGFPEMMDGRVKTLHPAIHGGLLALRDHADHVASMAEHGIRPIDLVCINLYPFAKTIENPAVTLDEAIENIDIGGPSMIRSAAKNNAWVLVVTSPGRYEKVLGDLRQHAGASCAKHRLKQAQSAFAHTAEYDGLIAKFLAKRVTPEVAAERSERQDQPAGGPARHVAEQASGQVATAAPPFEEHDQSSVVQRLVEPTRGLGHFLHDLATAQGLAVSGTDAAAFAVTDKWLDSTGRLHFEWDPVTNIRPGPSGTWVPAPAVATVKAFQWFVDRCATDGKDDAVGVGGASESTTASEPQFCLVTLLRNGADVVAATAVVRRCSDAEAARGCLGELQRLAKYFDRHADRLTATPRSNPMAERVDLLPEQFQLALAKVQNLRYGENPHQKAALYVGRKPAEASVAFATQHHGKELSYINLLDADGALACVKEFADPAACIVKHTTPCGCATADDVGTAFDRAYAGDPLAAFGGIVAVNKPIDLAAAQRITSIDKLLEVIVAPYYAADALDLLRSRWKNVRLLEVGPVVQGGNAQHPARRDAAEVNLHKIAGGYLVQERDLLGLDESTWKVASTRPPTEAELADLRFAWLTCKHVKSNAIVVCKSRMLLGAGAGQMDRPSAARLAIAKAGDRIANSVAASDAFFPFPDGPRLLLDAGVTAIIHPGGSLKDQETIDLVNERGAALVLTGRRHFKH